MHKVAAITMTLLFTALSLFVLVYAEEDPPGREEAIDNACANGRNPHCDNSVAPRPHPPIKETGENTGIFVNHFILGLLDVDVNQAYAQLDDPTLQMENMMDEIYSSAFPNLDVPLAEEQYQNGRTQAAYDWPVFNITCSLVDDYHCIPYIVGYIEVFDFNVGQLMNK